MRPCQKCGADNDDGSLNCARCGAPLAAEPPARTPEKVCPKCKTRYPADKRTCTRCAVSLIFPGQGSGEPEGWMYAVGALFPLVGIALGLIYIGRRDDEIGKSVLIISLLALVVWSALFFSLLARHL